MTTQPSQPDVFAVEREHYKKWKPSLLMSFKDKYVVVKGEAIIGPYETAADAEKFGYKYFGYGPIYIKQVLEEEPVICNTRDIEFVGFDVVPSKESSIRAVLADHLGSMRDANAWLDSTETGWSHEVNGEQKICSARDIIRDGDGDLILYQIGKMIKGE